MKISEKILNILFEKLPSLEKFITKLVKINFILNGRKSQLVSGETSHLAIPHGGYHIRLEIVYSNLWVHRN